MMSRDEGVRRFFSSPLPTKLRPYHKEEWEELIRPACTGLAGACIYLRLPSLSMPEIGLPYPVIFTNVERDLQRFIVDPVFEPCKEKGQDHMMITALAFTGEMMVVDTTDMSYLNWKDLVAELYYQYNLFTSIT